MIKEKTRKSRKKLRKKIKAKKRGKKRGNKKMWKNPSAIKVRREEMWKTEIVLTR
jgi:hypothetical protein